MDDRLDSWATTVAFASISYTTSSLRAGGVAVGNNVVSIVTMEDGNWVVAAVEVVSTGNDETRPEETVPRELRGGVKRGGVIVVRGVVMPGPVELGAALCVTVGKGEGAAKDKVAGASGTVGVLVPIPN